MPQTLPEHYIYTFEEWHEPQFVKMLDKLKNVRVFYDIGACTGAVVDVMRERFPDVWSYAFEPIKKNYEYTKMTTNTACYNVGIFYGKEYSKVRQKGENVGAYLVEYIPPGGEFVETGEVMKLMPLEHYDFLPKPDLIKMDVEGAEKNIIENSPTVQTCPQLIIEWHSDEDARAYFSEHLPHHKVIAKADYNFLLVRDA